MSDAESDYDSADDGVVAAAPEEKTNGHAPARVAEKNLAAKLLESYFNTPMPEECLLDLPNECNLVSTSIHFSCCVRGGEREASVSLETAVRQPHRVRLVAACLTKWSNTGKYPVTLSLTLKDSKDIVKGYGGGDVFVASNDAALAKRAHGCFLLGTAFDTESKDVLWKTKQYEGLWRLKELLPGLTSANCRAGLEESRNMLTKKKELKLSPFDDAARCPLGFYLHKLGQKSSPVTYTVDKTTKTLVVPHAQGTEIVAKMQQATSDTRPTVNLQDLTVVVSCEAHMSGSCSVSGQIQIFYSDVVVPKR